MDVSHLPYLGGIKELLRKLDETCAAAAKLRASIAGEMRAARASERIAGDDPAVIAARASKTR